MALYLVRSRYTSTAFQGMLAAPSDRGEAAKALWQVVMSNDTCRPPWAEARMPCHYWR
jgi:hypothetical protein